MPDPKDRSPKPNALEGIKVVDAATLFAGPVIATLMGDFGAEVIKVEHPKGDSLRTLGWNKDGVSLWWAVIARNKKGVTIKLSDERGAEMLRRILKDADVFIENFRPGTLERWGLGWEVIHELNPRLVMVRTTGFGQTGPWRDRPGFGTLAEAVSGFAYINGAAEGPPMLPPFALADGVAALTGAFAVMTALWWRERTGLGQSIDLSIYEPLFWILGPQASVYDQLGITQTRTGNRAPFTAPRNAYKTSDDHWVALSGSAQTIAERIMRAVDAEYMILEDWFADHTGRLLHADEIDSVISAWIAERDVEEVLARFTEFEAAIAPVLSIAEIMQHPQFLARKTVVEVEHPVLGALMMQNVITRLESSPGSIRTCGPELGEHNQEILGALGYSIEQLRRLAADGVIANGPSSHSDVDRTDKGPGRHPDEEFVT